VVAPEADEHRLPMLGKGVTDDHLSASTKVQKAVERYNLLLRVMEEARRAQ
jgi:hypothetical protein